MMMLAVSMIAMAQNKITLNALQLVNRQQTLERHGRLSAGINNNRLTLIVKVADEDAVETYNAIRDAGGQVEGVLGKQAIISIPASGVQSIAALKGIERIDATQKGKLLTDNSVKATKVSEILNKPAGYAKSLNGKGVMVCIIDCGFNFTHAAFTDGNGNSRIKCVYLMDQTEKEAKTDHKQLTYNTPNAGEVTAPGYYYDTPEGVKALGKNDGIYDTHGTHTAGIAVGTKSELGFTGMAPEADIMLIPAKGNFDPMHIETYISGLEKALIFAVNYAKQKGLNLIISMSVGCHEGPHNGTGTIPELLDEVAKVAIPVMSSGNEGSNNPHIYKKFTTADNTLKAMLPMEENNYTANPTYSAAVNVYGISRQTAVTGQTVKVKLGLYHQDKTKWAHEVTYKVGDPAITWGANGDIEDNYPEAPYDETLDPYVMGPVAIIVGTVNGKLNIKAMVNASAMFKPEEGGKPDPFSLIIEGYDGLEMDLWENNKFTNASGYTQADNEMSANDWVTTPNIISVGAYCTNTTARKVANKDEDQSDKFTLGDIAHFSSYGHFSNGVSVPMVCAPGVNIVSSINPISVEEDEIPKQKTSMMWKDCPYDSESGTSMACPHVAGIIALWLQANPGLNFEAVKDVLKNSCDTDEFTAKTPLRWGYGKINAQKGLNYVLTHTLEGIEEVNGTEPQSQNAKIYNLQGCQVTNPTHGIYIVGGRKVVIK